MDRRAFLVALPAIAVALGPRLHAAPFQDVEFIRAWERAQRLRPRSLTSRTRIAPPSEPGTPLIVTGRLYDRDGRSPAPGITVFAYQTDAQGHYDVPANGPHSWRLKGWALTDAAGGFEFTTIRPAPYPRRTEPAHIHLYIEGPRLQRRSAGILFDDDPLVTREERATSTNAGDFGSVLAIRTHEGVQRVSYKIRITDEGVF